jgi:parallel beta-helix repeat protein
MRGKMRIGIHILCQLALAVMLITVLYVGSVLSPSLVNATEYYVAPNGNDANPGGKSEPFSTIKKGISVLTPSDTLYLRQGTYNEFISPTIPGMNIPSGTSWSNAITIASYPGEDATITGGISIQDNMNGSAPSFLIFDRLIVDLQAVPGDINGTNSAFRVVSPNVHHIRFSNGEIKNAANHLVLVGGGTSHCEIMNSKIHGAKVSLFGGTHPTTGNYGFYYNGHDGLIEGNVIYDNTGYGLHLYHSGSNDVNNNIVRNNIFYGNGFDDGERHDTLGGVIIASGENNLFYNNIVDKNTGIGVTVAYTNGSRNNQLYNNTVFGNSGSGIEIFDSAPQTVVRNNIVYGNGGTIADWGAVGTVLSNNLTTDPKFVNPSAHDFLLQEGSPAIDAGVMVSAVTTDIIGVPRPQGGIYDIGAYEYHKGVAPLAVPSNLRLVKPAR